MTSTTATPTTATPTVAACLITPGSHDAFTEFFARHPEVVRIQIETIEGVEDVSLGFRDEPEGSELAIRPGEEIAEGSDLRDDLEDALDAWEFTRS